jgi:hypothetical protein
LRLSTSAMTFAFTKGNIYLIHTLVIIHWLHKCFMAFVKMVKMEPAYQK